MKIGIGQINPKVGDLKGNTNKIIDYLHRAKKENCDLVVFPELSISGYPPRDLLLKGAFLKACDRMLQQILPHTMGIAAIIGTIIDEGHNHLLYNSALLLDKGRISQRVDKSLLPNYGVFEEARYFMPSKEVRCFDFQGKRIGVSICEDIWNQKDAFGRTKYSRDILDELYREKPDLFINLSASPYYFGKHKIRKDMLAGYCEKYHIPFIYANQIGGNDELVFDGSSMVYDSMGQMILQAKSFEEDLLIYDTDTAYTKSHTGEEDISWIYKGLILGMRDYFHKSGLKKTLLGISGGIDSALAAVIAKEALGRQNVLGVFMPTRYTSKESKDDALALIKNLGIEYREITIEDLFHRYLKIFNEGQKSYGDLAEENIQARIRGNILMFISNREGGVLISPSNKSEIAVGYSTLYGDSCGGLAILGDIFKSQVYDLCNYINSEEEIIPNNIVTKAPTAELRDNQKDEDSLPPYPVLDGILKMYIEENLSPEEIHNAGFKKDIVLNTITMVDRAEYKRIQIPPIIRMSRQSFGLGRRPPIVHGFKPEL